MLGMIIRTIAMIRKDTLGTDSNAEYDVYDSERSQDRSDSDSSYDNISYHVDMTTNRSSSEEESSPDSLDDMENQWKAKDILSGYGNQPKKSYMPPLDSQKYKDEENSTKKDIVRSYAKPQVEKTYQSSQSR